MERYSVKNVMDRKYTDMQKGKKINTQKIAVCALLTAIALIFSYIESMLPIPFPVPGMRLGFANIAIIAVLYLYGFKEALTVNVIRIILASLLFGNINSFFFSIAGGLASLCVMYLLKKTGKFSVIAVSGVGGVVHNIAQIFISIWVLGSPAIGYLMPIFIILGVVTGIICGIVAKIFLYHIKKTRGSE